MVKYLNNYPYTMSNVQILGSLDAIMSMPLFALFQGEGCAVVGRPQQNEPRPLQDLPA